MLMDATRTRRAETDPCEVMKARLQAQDPGAWSELMEAHGPALLGYARRMLRDPDAAEDVVQSSLVSAFRKLDGFDCRAGLRAWLFRIVHNRSIDELRKRKRFVDVDADDPDASLFSADGAWLAGCPSWGGNPEAQVGARRLLDVVREEMDGLPHSYREVLLLKEVHGLESAEVCEALGVSPGNLRIRIHRARKALRAAVVERGVER
jgi:RNA polymerase sigma-70 factor, ECF subfamily